MNERRGSEGRKLQPMKSVVTRLMARQGYSQVQSADACQNAWKEAAGTQLAQHTRAGNVSRGKLLVLASNSAVLQAIMFQKRQILKTLQSLLPDHRIEDLKLKVGRIE